MRNAFIDTLTQLAKRDPNIFLITADTGFHVLDKFKKLFPDQYLNVGISEASMIGISAGLSLCGKTVFLYAIVPFITMRCFEQIRIDLCYQNLPVKLVGVGQGLTYGTAGATHHSIEDIGIMRCLPNMTVVCPGDPVEVEQTIKNSLNLKGPCYIRLGKSGEKRIHAKKLKDFSIGKGVRIHRGENIAIMSTGNMLETATDVYDIVKKEGLNPELISMHTIKPLDNRLISDISKRCRYIVTLEEHSVIGGLGSSVSDTVTDKKLDVTLIKFALPDKYVDIVGDQADLRDHYGLTAEDVAESILKLYSKI